MYKSKPVSSSPTFCEVIGSDPEPSGLKGAILSQATRELTEDERMEAVRLLRYQGRVLVWTPETDVVECFTMAQYDAVTGYVANGR